MKTETADLRQVILDMPLHIKESIDIVGSFKLDFPINSIIVTGMGGSAIAGDILKTYIESKEISQSLKTKLRIEVNREYELPKWADENTLVFVSSYSGNTEETISAYRDAHKRRCKVIGITSGGKIKEMCWRNDHKAFFIPQGLQPRSTVCYSFFIMLRILENSGIIPEQAKYIADTFKALKNQVHENIAKDLAKSLVGKIPLIYSSSALGCVAYRWKCEFNENSKIHAFYHLLSELDHNEIVGYTKKLADFHVIFLKDADDSKHIEKRIGVTKNIIKRYGVPCTVIAISGPCRLARLFSSIMIGDLTSYYLAKEYNIDPVQVKIIEELKEMLKE